jgi:hypothetical protein
MRGIRQWIEKVKEVLIPSLAWRRPVYGVEDALTERSGVVIMMDVLGLGEVQLVNTEALRSRKSVQWATRGLREAWVHCG